MTQRRMVDTIVAMVSSCPNKLDKVKNICQLNGDDKTK